MDADVLLHPQNEMPFITMAIDWLQAPASDKGGPRNPTAVWAQVGWSAAGEKRIDEHASLNRRVTAAKYEQIG